MRRTAAQDLLIAAVAGLAFGYVFVRLTWTSLPPFRWYMALPLATLAVAELWIARRVRAAVRHRPGAKPVTALAIARSVALAKASVVVGTAVAGAAFGLVVYVAPDVDTIAAARHDLWAGLILAVTSVAVAVGGLILERSAIDPSQQ